MTQEPLHPMTLDNSEPNPGDLPRHNAIVDCGWGRLLFAHTFNSPEELLAAMREEALASGTSRCTSRIPIS
ncbi:hypothetical protein [Marinobacterium aestuariivivens]|uniref:Uncharacterized protein n=1 Tax=Marinobacterium aestuariivivens TaxID=1698799 RepID=A0ABW2A4Y3_9GAMM